MSVAIDFENDYQKKLMVQTFKEPTLLDTAAKVQAWRSAWMQALSSWHSPYKVLVEGKDLTIVANDEVLKALKVMVKFFNGFFLRKIVIAEAQVQDAEIDALPIKVCAQRDEALAELGIRQMQKRDPTDFRSTIQFQNHFQQHTIELSFIDPVVIDSSDKVKTLKSKLTNNLMQWHSKWSLLVDCAHLEIAPEQLPELERMLIFMQGFFMKKAIGYSPKGAKETYPFKVYRSRHRAAAELEGEGNFSGDVADCRSKKSASN